MGGVAAAHVPAGVFASFVSSPYPRGFGELYIKKKKKEQPARRGSWQHRKGETRPGFVGLTPPWEETLSFCPEQIRIFCLRSLCTGGFWYRTLQVDRLLCVCVFVIYLFIFFNSANETERMQPVPQLLFLKGCSVSGQIRKKEKVSKPSFIRALKCFVYF